MQFQNWFVSANKSTTKFALCYSFGSIQNGATYIAESKVIRNIQ